MLGSNLDHDVGVFGHYFGVAQIQKRGLQRTRFRAKLEGRTARDVN